MMIRSLAAAVALVMAASVSGMAQDAAGPTDPLAAYRAQAEKQWEAEIVKLEEQDQSQPDPNDAILFIGSSSIRLWKDLAADLAPRHTVNRGYGGAKFSDLAVYIERIVKPHAFQSLVIFVANDIVGKPDDKTPEEVVRLFQYIVAQVRQTHSRQPIFLIAITPTPSRFAVWPEIQRTNAALQKVCDADASLHFIATDKHYLDGDGKPIGKYFIEDKLHQNRMGYLVWGGIVKESLDRVLGLAAASAP
jgi:lysophospholipase L1-like esterase